MVPLQQVPPLLRRLPLQGQGLRQLLLLRQQVDLQLGDLRQVILQQGRLLLVFLQQGLRQLLLLLLQGLLQLPERVPQVQV